MDFELPGSIQVKTDDFNLYGCRGGSWEGVTFSMTYSQDAKREAIFQVYNAGPIDTLNDDEW
jgi:hypothetical protein